MIIKTKEFILRYPKRSDLKTYWKNYNDKEIKKGFIVYSKNIKEAKKELERKIKEKDESFIIDVNGDAVGEVIFSDIIPKLKAKIGYWISRDFRGKGIMTEAVKIATDCMFKKYKLKRIYGNVRTYNKASARVLEKTGFKLEGIQRKASLKNGEYYDDYLYAKVK
jgi:RimJ/RimL family protein N-acetyltransferase